MKSKYAKYTDSDYNLEIMSKLHKDFIGDYNYPCMGTLIHIGFLMFEEEHFLDYNPNEAFVVYECGFSINILEFKELFKRYMFFMDLDYGIEIDSNEFKEIYKLNNQF